MLQMVAQMQSMTEQLPGAKSKIVPPPIGILLGTTLPKRPTTVHTSPLMPSLGVGSILNFSSPPMTRLVSFPTTGST